MSGRRSSGRFPIRARLTLVFAGAFFLFGLALVGTIYDQLGSILEQELTVSATLSDVDSAGSATLAEPANDVSAQAGSLDEAKGLVDLQFAYARDETLERMFLACLLLLALIGSAAGGFGWLMAGQFLRPLREITETARRVAGRSLHQRIALQGPSDEIKELADTLDAMFERLDRAFDSQQRFIANASHELRTPLAIYRTLIEVEMLVPGSSSERLRAVGRKLLDINTRCEALIEGLLVLATSEQPLTDAVEIDLADLARHVAEECNEHARVAGLKIDTELAETPVKGDPVLLERAVHNLVENAISYNLQDNGWVRIVTRRDEGRLVLSVENSGPVVPAQDVPMLLEPFRRLPGSDRLANRMGPAANRGVGLGLSIVRAIAQAHGGDIEASARREGGLSVALVLPLARAA